MIYDKNTRIFLYQIIKYGLAGLIAVAVDMTVLNLLVIYAGIKVLLAATISFLLGTSTGFILNRKYTFKIKNRDGASGQFIKFATIGAIGLILNTIFMYFFMKEWEMHYNVAKLLSIIIVFFWNFSMNRFWTFTPREEKSGVAIK